MELKTIIYIFNNNVVFCLMYKLLLILKYADKFSGIFVFKIIIYIFLYIITKTGSCFQLINISQICKTFLKYYHDSYNINNDYNNYFDQMTF